MDKEIETSLLGMDEEIHRLLHYLSKKEKDTETRIEDYENLKRKISSNLKEPLYPTEEIRGMREKGY
jgi:hypothetical protein